MINLMLPPCFDVGMMERDGEEDGAAVWIPACSTWFFSLLGNESPGEDCFPIAVLVRGHLMCLAWSCMHFVGRGDLRREGVQQRCASVYHHQ